ncbi:hypothetical protein ASE73_02360 [Sphingomonas sp. Leaf24]|uniref:hypothetical protein n=1 Tax=unclassified Sphingomonas TaxID=196159 RepID=UPI0006F3104E|nr:MULTISPECIES: hypothetical protein [unclassified Sphingomonas]KQM23085.1 hypothetical protein ASE50_02360 [Sphingomonas sp. Leaf5]KQM95943.1 hypothetical protein ASE73_02360 [Sphingomonas sp. Leaf24]
MADPTGRAWRALRTIGALRVDRAQAGHRRAVLAERDTEHALAAADTALVEAADAWQRQVIERFDPALGSAYAAVLTRRADALVAATEAHRSAAHDTEGAAAMARREQARGEAVATQATAAMRLTRRHADERALMAIADRAALNWMRR